MPTPIRIKFSLPIGDFWYACAGIRNLCRLMKCKADIYMELDVHIRFLKSGDPTQTELRPCITRTTFDLAKPLILAQPWCNSVNEWKGEEVTIDLDRTQLDPNYNLPVMPYGAIYRWYSYLFPDMNCDFSKPWIETGKMPYIRSHYMLVNRTARYRNDAITYSFLKPWEDKIGFIGLPDEHQRFNQENGLSVPHLQCKDFLELAMNIQLCRVFLGNQSMCFALAEAMKIPRILEVCTYAPNVIPQGENVEDFVYQEALEYYVKRKMAKRKMT